ncbi:hypothetical protein CBL_13641 [Carabus blaptoides fortunei]
MRIACHMRRFVQVCFIVTETDVVLSRQCKGRNRIDVSACDLSPASAMNAAGGSTFCCLVTLYCCSSILCAVEDACVCLRDVNQRSSLIQDDCSFTIVTGNKMIRRDKFYTTQVK